MLDKKISQLENELDLNLALKKKDKNKTYYDLNNNDIHDQHEPFYSYLSDKAVIFTWNDFEAQFKKIDKDISNNNVNYTLSKVSTSLGVSISSEYSRKQLEKYSKKSEKMPNGANIKLVAKYLRPQA